MKNVKKIAICGLLSSILVSAFYLPSVTASADEVATMSINVDKTTVKLDDIITVSVSLNNIEEYTGCGVSLTYDSNVLDFVEKSNTTIDGGLISVMDTGTSIKYIDVIGSGSTTYTGELFTATFKVVDNTVDSFNFDLTDIEVTIDNIGTLANVNASSVEITIKKDITLVSEPISSEDDTTTTTTPPVSIPISSEDDTTTTTTTPVSIPISSEDNTTTTTTSVSISISSEENTTIITNVSNSSNKNSSNKDLSSPNTSDSLPTIGIFSVLLAGITMILTKENRNN